MSLTEFFNCEKPTRGYLVSLAENSEELLENLDNFHASRTRNDSVLLYRGQPVSNWTLDSKFSRELLRTDGAWERALLKQKDLHQTPDGYHFGLKHFFKKFGTDIKISPIGRLSEIIYDIDPWFEIMKKYQQYPESDSVRPRGTNLVDWTTSFSVALFFGAGGYSTNKHTDDDGSIWILDATNWGPYLVNNERLNAIFKKVLEKNGEDAVLPFIFCPRKQKSMPRARRQEAFYLAQFDFRWPLEEVMGIDAKKNKTEPTLVKIVIPAQIKADLLENLKNAGTTYSYLFSD